MSIAFVARTLSEEILAKPAPPPPRPVILPDIDEDFTEGEQSIGFAEGQSFAIEYVDSAGKLSTRRITVWSIVGGTNGVPSLLAHCHERKAQRQFRVDRIQCCIDYDGEIFSDVPRFLCDNFGMTLLIAKKTDNAEERWPGILATIRHEAVLLAALAKADGKVRPEEVEAETDYLSRIAERTGVMLDEGDIAAIRRYVGRLRPSEDAILRALNALALQGAARVQKLLMAAIAVIDADGKRHDREIEMINAISVDLTGVPIA